MRKIQISIIVLLSILIIGCITFVAIAFTTDTFKSDKDLFYKYAKQIDLKEFINLESYINYLNRLNNEAHGSEGEIRVDITQREKSISEAIKYSRIY